jgi:arylsulfatase A
MPHERFQGRTPLGYRGDAIVELDWCVGELMKALDHLELAEDTLVVFCSDNGPVLDDGYKDGAVEKLGEHRPSGPFSGGKYSVYEGGTRTPFIARWKGRIEPGVSDEVVCTIDLPASFAALAGVALPEDACPDSFNVLGALLGEDGADGRDYLVQQDNGRRGNYGLRAGKWKLQRHDSKSARNVAVERRLASTPVPRNILFDLSQDPAEQHDVLAEHPEVAERLKGRLEEAIQSNRTRP